MEKNLQDWIKEIAESPGFLQSFRHDPAATLQERGFCLHESYTKLMEQLTEEQKKATSEAFDRIAKAGSSQELRAIYAELVDQYERLFGWEGLQVPGPRGWNIPPFSP